METQTVPWTSGLGGAELVDWVDHIHWWIFFCQAFDIRLLLAPKPAMILPSGPFGSHGPDDTKSRSENVGVEELRSQLRDLRGAVELMGKQHK